MLALMDVSIDGLLACLMDVSMMMDVSIDGCSLMDVSIDGC